MRKLFLLLVLLSLASIKLFSQENKTLKGKVFDKKTLQPVPYAIIEIEGSIFGVEANGKGKFQLPIHPNDKAIIVSANRYESDTFLISKIKGKSLFLNPKIIELEEIFIGGISAKDYMKKVVRNLDKYKYKSDYQYRAYSKNHTYGFDTKAKQLYTYSDEYAAITVINNSSIRKYNKKKKDSVDVSFSKPQSRLVLYQRTKNKNAKNHPFLNKKFDKMIRFSYKQFLKSSDSTYKRKEIKALKNDFDLPIEVTNGTPNYVYYNSKLNHFSFPLLDTTKYKKMTLWFEISPYVEKSKDVVIGFKTKAIDNVIYKGTIKINKEDLFPYDIKQKNIAIVPLFAKPIMRFVMGFKVKNIFYSDSRHYVKIGKYYFLDTYSNSVRMTFFRNFFFKENASFTVAPSNHFKLSNYKLNNIKQIDSSMFYKPRSVFKDEYKDPKTHNLENFSWKDFR